MFHKPGRRGFFPLGDQVMERHRFEDLADLVGEAAPQHVNEEIVDPLTSTRFPFAVGGLGFGRQGFFDGAQDIGDGNLLRRLGQEIAAARTPHAAH